MSRGTSTERPWRSIRLRRTGLALVTGVVGLALAAPAAVADDALTANGESGRLEDSWSAARGARVLPEAALGQSRGGYEIKAYGEPGFLAWKDAIPSGRSYFSVKAWVQLKDRGRGESVDLFTVRNGRGSEHFDFFVTGDTSTFKWDLFHEDFDSAGFPVQMHRWYLIEVVGGFAGGRYSATVRIDGVPQGTIVTEARKPTTVKSFWLGTVNAKTHRQFYDEMQVRVGRAPFRLS